MRWLLAFPFLLAACGDDQAPAVSDDSSGASDPESSSSGLEPATDITGTSETGASSGESVDTSEGSDGSQSSSSGGFDLAPVADDDVFRTPMDVALAVEAAGGVLANDHDPEASALEVLDAGTETETARGGTVVVAADGAFVYTPPPVAWGPDSFGYRVVDAAGNEASATATINLLPVEIPVSSLAAGEGGFELVGAPDVTSYSVATGGDINGDGIDDFVIGQPFREIHSGAVVVFGTSELTTPDLDARAGDDGGFAIEPTRDYSRAGERVAALGDINGDGFDDVGVADPVVAQPVDGIVEQRVYVVFGKADTDPVPLTELDDSGDGFSIIVGTPLFDQVPHLELDAAGDVNGDGLADILVAVDRAAGTTDMRAWIVFGTDDASTVELDAVSDGDGGFRIDGGAFEPYDGHNFLWARGAGDVNGDGLHDVVLGNWSANAFHGRVSVVFGKTDTDPVDLEQLNDDGFAIDGAVGHETFGTTVGGAGDVNGDGMDDIVIGAHSPIGADGHAFVVYGTAETDTIEAADVWLGDGGFGMVGEILCPPTWTGFSVDGGGDVDGDAMDDIVVSSVCQNGYAEQRAYVVYGAESHTSPLTLEHWPDGDVGYFVEIPMDDQILAFGQQVEIGGDVNDDGLADVLIASLAFPARLHVLAGTSRAPY